MEKYFDVTIYFDNGERLNIVDVDREYDDPIKNKIIGLVTKSGKAYTVNLDKVLYVMNHEPKQTGGKPN